MTQEETARAIGRAERALYDAMIAEDYPALEKILAPDVVYIHSTAVAESRDEYFAGVRKGLYEYESVSSRNNRFRTHGNVVLQDGICDMVVGETGKGKRLIHLMFLLVWVNDGGAWRLVHRHATRMP